MAWRAPTLAALLVLAGGAGLAQPFGPPDRDFWPLDDYRELPTTWVAEGFAAEGCEAMFVAGPPYQGRPTRIFAYLGLPALQPGERVPAMVLVHGGGGTAFAEWVARWTQRGYAAIAMDTCGQIPRGTYGNWERHEHSGPPGWGGLDQLGAPLEDQWTYHAVASVLLAHTVLANRPEVDPARIGLTGISWGGYLASIVAGVDSRLQCVIPVYGTGFYQHTVFSEAADLTAEPYNAWQRNWDPGQYLGRAEMPLCWVTGSNDFFFWPPALQASYRAANGPQTLCVRLRMPHGHGDAGEGPAEIFAFADSVLRGGEPLARVYNASRAGAAVQARVESPRPLANAELCYTTAAGRWPDRLWETLPAEVLGDPRRGATLRATLPAGTTAWYFNVFDDRDLCVSSEHEELTGD